MHRARPPQAPHARAFMLHGTFPQPDDPPSSPSAHEGDAPAGKHLMDRRSLVVAGLAISVGAVASTGWFVWRGRESRAGTKRAATKSASQLQRSPPDWLSEMRAMSVDERVLKAGRFERLSRRALTDAAVADEFETLAMIVLASPLAEADLAGQACVRTLAKFERFAFLERFATAARQRPQLRATTDLTTRFLRERRRR